MASPKLNLHVLTGAFEAVVFGTLIFALACGSSIVAAQEAGDEIIAVGELPEGYAAGRAKPFLEAFNTCDEAAIGKFVETQYALRNSTMTTAYLMGVAREVGPVSVHSVERITIFEEQRNLIWLRGDRTHTLIGLELRTEPEEPHRLTGQSVIRGIQPLHNATFQFPEQDAATYFSDYLSELAAHDHFSGVVLIARGGEVLFEGAYGQADQESSTPNTLDTRFRLASVTKTFTGVAAAQLAQESKLEFEDPISKHIPEYPEHINSKVTIHQLLTHQSGIELDENPRYNAAIAKAESMDDILRTQLEFIEQLNRGSYENFEPLGSFDYSNEGIDLAGVIVERVSGEPWAEYIQSHIFDPAGMTNSGAGFPADVQNIATGYSSFSRFGSPVADRRPVKGVTEIGALRPAGSGWSTARDVFRFFEALRTHKLLTAEFVDAIWHPHVKASLLDTAGETRHYGYTFDVIETNGIQKVGHRGDSPGVSTGAYLYPETGWIAVVLSNYDRAGDVVLSHVEEFIEARGDASDTE